MVYERMKLYNETTIYIRIFFFFLSGARKRNKKKMRADETQADTASAKVNKTEKEKQLGRRVHGFTGLISSILKELALAVVNFFTLNIMNVFFNIGNIGISLLQYIGLM